MKEDELIKSFIGSKDYCFSVLSKRVGAKSALRKLINMDNRQAKLYGREFEFHFNHYRKAHKRVIQIISQQMRKGKN